MDTGPGTDIDRCAHAHKTNSCNESNLYRRRRRRRRCFRTIHSLSLSVCNFFFTSFNCACEYVSVCYNYDCWLLVAVWLVPIYASIFWTNLLHDMNWSLIYHDAPVQIFFPHKKSLQWWWWWWRWSVFLFVPLLFFFTVWWYVAAIFFSLSMVVAPQFIFIFFLQNTH